MVSSEPVKFSDDVSVDKIAVIGILNRLDYAESSLMTGEYENALDNIDMAWVKLPNLIREKVRKPSEAFQERVKAEVPSIYEMLASHRYDNMSVRGVKSESVSMKIRIAEEVVKESMLSIITALDNAGLYIKLEKGIQPTSEKKAREQPPLKSLPTNLPRETS